MHVAVIGTGYVGLVAGACLAETGNDVVCSDIIENKIARLNAGEIPIYEPGLEPLVERNLRSGRLTFTTDIPEAVRASEIIFIAVGTPPDEDGSADLQHILDAARTIGRAMNGEKIVITKSTVPVGTAAKVREAVEAETDHPVHVCSNPEFLKEGAAVEDFMKPDRVVLGVDSEYAAAVLRDLYAPFVRTGHDILLMDVAAAEITKYAANAMLALRISFMNSVADLCSRTGADVDSVRRGVGSDSRIGSSFLFPGVGYGGSCLLGQETVLARRKGCATLVRLDALFEDCAVVPSSVTDDLEPEVTWTDDLTVLSWSPDGGPQWRRASAVTRRWYEGEVLKIRTKMGRRLRCTPDHPFVVSDGVGGAPQVKLAQELTTEDWLPVAMGQPAALQEADEELEVVGTMASMGFREDEVIVRLGAEARAGLELAQVRTAVMEHPRSANCYTQRLPDAVWDLSSSEQIALLSGLWQGDGSWSLVNGGQSVVLEWGTVSRELADGVVRLLGGLGFGARLKVGRTAKSTTDTHWVAVAGANQVEQLIELVKPADRPAVLASLARQTKRVAPTGYRPARGVAWVRVTESRPVPFRGWVYSVEVPGKETFVTTAGLVVHNCFPKDVNALANTMREMGTDGSILDAVHAVNEAQKRLLIEGLVDRLGADLSGQTIAIWGLAFKPNTDDMREAPSLVTIAGLLEAGARVVAHDPAAMGEARRILGDSIELVDANYDALKDADALVIHTEWLPYRHPDFGRMRSLMAQPLVFDGRNLYSLESMAEAGFEYYSVGRPAVGAPDQG